MSIEKAYKKSKNIYDDILTQKSFLGKIYMKIFWGGGDDNEIAKKVLNYIPDNFDGKILDVPVGTAVFTHEKWKKLSNAQITCLDYSTDMLNQAKERFLNCEHINCVQGDVSNLEFSEESFDIVFSMNGFHAFPDKPKAYEEIFRVLKKDGMFISTFYIEGQSKITDLWVDKFLAKKGWFTKPFESLDDVKNNLSEMYKSVEIRVEGSMIYFMCKK
ncbi:MAG: class I SAM-dependent methyltransferase [Clostridia bacterium]